MAKEKRKKKEKAERKNGHEKPVSLYPLSAEEALRKLLQVRPPPKKKKPTQT